MRRLPAPWRAKAVAGGYVVEDDTGRALAYVYGEDVQSVGTLTKLTHDEARRVAANIAKLPDLMRPELTKADHRQ